AMNMAFSARLTMMDYVAGRLAHDNFPHCEKMTWGSGAREPDISQVGVANANLRRCAIASSDPESVRKRGQAGWRRLLTDTLCKSVLRSAAEYGARNRVRYIARAVLRAALCWRLVPMASEGSRRDAAQWRRSCLHSRHYHAGQSVEMDGDYAPA